MRGILAGLAVIGPLSTSIVGVAEEQQNDDYGEVGEIAIIGTRLTSTTFSELTTSTVIDPEFFASHSVNSSADAVGLVPGVYIEQPGGRGGRSSLYLRAADPNATLVMIDGIKVNDPNSSLGGTYDLNLIDPSFIGQVEVVRGPGASIYGADALAGAINIHTKTAAAPPAARAAVTIGGDGMRGAQGGFSYSANGHSGMLQAAYRDDGTPVEGSEFLNRSVRFTHRAAIKSASTLGVQLLANNNDSASFPDDSGGPRYASLRALERRASEDVGASVSYEYAPTHRQELKLATSYFERSEFTDSPGIAPGPRDPFGIPASTSDSELERYSLVATMLNRYAGGHQTIVGAEVTSEDGNSRSSLDFGGVPVDSSFDLQRNAQALFFYGRLRPLENVTGEAGLRADHVESGDTEINPSASVRWGAAPQLEVNLNWGRGFKLPSFYALGNPIVGNPDLKSETSQMLDGGIVFFQLGRFEEVALTAFRNRFENLVDFDAGPPPQLINRGEVLTRGVELASRARFSRAAWLAAQATYTRHEIVGSSEPLFNRPQWVGAVTLNYAFSSATELAARMRYTGSRYDSSIPTGTVKLAPYFRVDANVNHRINSSVRTLIGIDNLFDEDYEDAAGFQSAGLRAYATVELQW